MLRSGQTPKHLRIRKLLDDYLDNHNSYVSGFTSWYNRVKAFREGPFTSVIYGSDDSLNRIVRPFCDALVAFYSFTDGSTLKRSILEVLEAPDEEDEPNNMHRCGNKK